MLRETRENCNRAVEFTGAVYIDATQFQSLSFESPRGKRDLLEEYDRRCTILPKRQGIAEIDDEPHHSAADSGPHSSPDAGFLRGYQFLRVSLDLLLLAIEGHHGPDSTEDLLGDIAGLPVSRQLQGRQRALNLGDDRRGDYYDRCTA